VDILHPILDLWFIHSADNCKESAKVHLLEKEKNKGIKRSIGCHCLGIQTSAHVPPAAVSFGHGLTLRGISNFKTTDVFELFQ
jgi:hypothetical protein